MKIGFACKYFHPDRTLPAKALKEEEQKYNFKSTTAKWLKDNPKLAYKRLEEICIYNAECVVRLVDLVSSWAVPLRMLRIGSDVLPMYTHKDFRTFYKKAPFMQEVENLLAASGHRARAAGVKLSMHPGQFCVLASNKPDVIANSIEEFEYHADVIRMMGYARSKLDFKCNVHLSGAGGAEQFLSTYQKLSTEARRVITLENDEYTSDLNDLLPLADYVGIVLDIHHYWIYNGSFISSQDPRLEIIEQSWQGRRPTIHYSYSREEHLKGLTGAKPDLNDLVYSGIPKSKLRAHSDSYPNPTMNRYALEFLPRFDIMCEAKHKNEASTLLYKQAVRVGVL